MPFPLVQKSAISDACSRSDVSFYVLFRFRYINLCSKIQKDPSEQRATFESFSSDAQPSCHRSDWSFGVFCEMKQSLLSRESLNKFVLFRQMVWTSLSPLLGRGRVLIFAKNRTRFLTSSSSDVLFCCLDQLDHVKNIHAFTRQESMSKELGSKSLLLRVKGGQ